MNLKDKRKLKLSVLNFPEWKKNSTCYVFSVRPKNLDPDDTGLQWVIDTWFKVDYNEPDVASQTVNMIKLRARANMAHVYGIWLPNELASDIDADDNPEDYMDIIMKYKFKI